MDSITHAPELCSACCMHAAHALAKRTQCHTVHSCYPCHPSTRAIQCHTVQQGFAFEISFCVSGRPSDMASVCLTDEVSACDHPWKTSQPGESVQSAIAPLTVRFFHMKRSCAVEMCSRRAVLISALVSVMYFLSRYVQSASRIALASTA